MQLDILLATYLQSWVDVLSFDRCAVSGIEVLLFCSTDQSLLAEQVSAWLQVDHAYLQYGPDHNIVAFMQSLGYSDFTAVSADEEKMSQFKRALKLTRPAFAATRSPMQQVLACLSCCLFTSA